MKTISFTYTKDNKQRISRLCDFMRYFREFLVVGKQILWLKRVANMRESFTLDYFCL